MIHVSACFNADVYTHPIVREKKERMFRSMQKNWVAWMRVATVTAAIMAILVSAFAMSPEIDRRFLNAEPAVASAANVSAIDGGAAQSTQDRNCHIGHSCTLVILPTNDLALLRLDTAPELSRGKGHLPSVVGDMPFHPPRVLSLV